LVNGYPYVVPDHRVKGNPYFLDNQWKKGTVYINGNAFNNKDLKYNIHRDVLVLKAKFDSSVYKLVQVNKLYIDSFKIGDRLFVQSSHYKINREIPTFYEQIYNNEITFVKRYTKQIVRLSYSRKHGSFANTSENRFIIRDGAIENVRTRGAFIRSFPRHKRKEIRKLLREMDINYSKATSRELRMLLLSYFK
jgi:hypothetical protein